MQVRIITHDGEHWIFDDPQEVAFLTNEGIEFQCDTEEHEMRAFRYKNPNNTQEDKQWTTTQYSSMFR